MFQLVTEANDEYCVQYDGTLSRSLCPGLRSFAEWAATIGPRR